MSEKGYARFVATATVPPVALSSTGRKTNAAPSAVTASAATIPSSQSAGSALRTRPWTSSTIEA